MIPLSASRQSGRILLVEDIDDLRFILKRLLEMDGFEVLEAGDGAEALRLIQTEPCHLLLLDLRLQGLSGLEVTRQLRALPQFQALPIIIISAVDDETTRAEAQAAGCSDYLAKPIDFDRLLSLLGKYILSPRAASRPTPLSEPIK